jgi:hypothetical protein
MTIMTMAGLMTTAMKKMMTDKSGFITAAALSVAAIAAFIINLHSQVPLAVTALPLAGIASYFTLIKLGAYDRHVACDYIQTGEAAVGSFALFISLSFLAGSGILPALVLASLLLYELFINTVIAPDKRELAMNGVLTQAVLAVAVLFFIYTGINARAPGADAFLLGHMAAFPLSPALTIAAPALAIIILCLSWALRPELRSYSQGPAFSAGSWRARKFTAVGLALTRGLLTTATILLAGWTCGIGISVNRIARGASADAVTLASLACFQQVIIMIAKLAGPWYAAAAVIASSYALFIIHLTKRTHLYDRHQKT